MAVGRRSAVQADQAAKREAAGSQRQETGRVFTTATGTPLGARQIRKMFQDVCETAGFGRDWVPRDLRHTFVSPLSDDGMAIEKIARLAGHASGLLRRDDDYAAAGKPACDYDDAAAREELVDALAKDAHALLAALDGRDLDPVLGQAAKLLATVTGQDLEESAGGVFRIARKVAADRVISTVDPQARHGHKTSARGFDGYKGHVAIDPDSEIITATEATPGNSGDAEVAESLLGEMLPGDQDSATAQDGGQAAAPAAGDGQPAVYGDAAYGSGELIGRLEDAGIYNGIKCQPPAAVKGCFPKDRFTIDLDGKTVTCPAGVTVPIRAATGRHAGAARFGAACRACPLAARCTTAKEGRTITIGPHEARLAAARQAQADPAWRAGYRATRPKVERKIGHLMRRRHGGRRARVRGLVKVAADFALLAAAVNLARLGVLGVAYRNGAWAAASD